MSLPFRTLSLPVGMALKDVDQAQGVITGYWSSFGVPDEGYQPDIVEKGAFAKTIAERGPESARPRIKFLFQHDPFRVLGVPTVLREDDFGLYFEAKISPTTWGRDVLTLYQDGVITEHSVGYDAIVEEFDKNRGVRVLKEVRLWEGSAVVWGANPWTPTVGVKSVTAQGLAERMARVEKALRGLKSDEIAEPLELQLKQWRAELQALDAAEKVDVKEGRVLSGANRKTISEAVSACEGAVEALKALLSATEPPEKGTPGGQGPPSEGVSRIKALMDEMRREAQRR